MTHSLCLMSPPQKGIPRSTAGSHGPAGGAGASEHRCTPYTCDSPATPVTAADGTGPSKSGVVG